MTSEAMQRRDSRCRVGGRKSGRKPGCLPPDCRTVSNLDSSLAYCATGNVSQSEDLAQETFVSAWKQLADLREPAKLRPWLCSITRFSSARSSGARGASRLMPPNRWRRWMNGSRRNRCRRTRSSATRKRRFFGVRSNASRKFIVNRWSCFIAEQQSIEAVAQDLELSEDAVKQRLSRGAKIVAGAISRLCRRRAEQTSPGKTFTLGVLAALPLLATTAKAATAGVTAAKGGAIAKTTGLGAFFQAISRPFPAFSAL